MVKVESEDITGKVEKDVGVKVGVEKENGAEKGKEVMK